MVQIGETICHFSSCERERCRAEERCVRAVKVEELLPCPHCGSTNALLQEHAGSGYSHSNYWGVSCFNPLCAQYGDTREEAVAAWNRRAP